VLLGHPQALACLGHNVAHPIRTPHTLFGNVAKVP
jgi:hypothetical protein